MVVVNRARRATEEFLSLARGVLRIPVKSNTCEIYRPWILVKFFGMQIYGQYKYLLKAFDIYLEKVYPW